MKLKDDFTVVRQALDKMRRTARWDVRDKLKDKAERALARIESRR